MTRIRGSQDIRIFGIQDRSSRPEARRPRIARWKVDGKEHSRSFRTRAEADRFRSRRWVAEQWPGWQLRTRRGDVYSLARFIPLVTGPGAAEPPERLRSYLCQTLPPDAEATPTIRARDWIAMEPGGPIEPGRSRVRRHHARLVDAGPVCEAAPAPRTGRVWVPAGRVVVWLTRPGPDAWRS